MTGDREHDDRDPRGDRGRIQSTRRRRRDGLLRRGRGVRVAEGTRPVGSSIRRQGPGTRGNRRSLRRIPDVHYGDGSHWVSGDRGVSEWMLTGTTTDGRATPASRLRPVDIPRWASRQEGLVLEDRGRVGAVASPPCPTTADRPSGRDDVHVLQDEDRVDAEDRPACPTGSRTSPLLYGALPHRSRAGQRMPAVGAGARAS